MLLSVQYHNVDCLTTMSSSLLICVSTTTDIVAADNFKQEIIICCIGATLSLLTGDYTKYFPSHLQHFKPTSALVSITFKCRAFIEWKTFLFPQLRISQSCYSKKISSITYVVNILCHLYLLYRVS